MGKHVHVISNIRPDLKVADCKGCGPDAPVVYKKHKGQWRCKVGDRRSSPDAARNRQVQSRFGISLSEYDRLVLVQQGACAICKETCATGRRLAVDHDHRCCPGRTSCGQCVRGLLCTRCNTSLGGFDDSPELLLRAVAYLTSK